MFNSACATAQMPLQALPHHSPAKAGSIANGRISVLDTQHALLNEVKHLAVKCGLEPVRYMAGKLLLQMNRLLTNRRIERHRLLDSIGRRLAASDYFD